MTDANLSARGGPARLSTPNTRTALGDLSDSVRAAFVQAGETDRYRLLAVLFDELANVGASPQTTSDPQISAQAMRLQSLAEEKANLEDLLSAAKADGAHRAAQIQAEQVRAEERQRILEDQRFRLDALGKERNRLDAELVQKNAALHQSETERDRLELQLQRADVEGASTIYTDRLESNRRELVAEAERLRSDSDQLRRDKDAEIERLKGELSRSTGSAGQEADAMLARLWRRLEPVKPPLVAGHEPPNAQSAERLVDGFVELVRFADDLDKSIRVFLDKYTKYHSSVKVPWEVYAKKEDVHETVRQMIAIKDARPVGLLRMKLRVLYSWCEAAMIGSDSAVESIASELEAFMREPPTELKLLDMNTKIKDFLRLDGHYQFMERIKTLRSQKLAATFGRGG